MSVYVYVVAAIFSVIIGYVIGCYARLLDEGISLKYMPILFKVIYVNTFGFVGFVKQNKEDFIEYLANRAVKKGTENRKEIVDSKIRELEQMWSEKYLRSIRKMMIGQLFFNYDFILKSVIETTKDISIKDGKYKSDNVMRHFSFSDIDIGYSSCVRVGR